MDYTNRLYFILHPNDALVASQLPPEDFAKHYTSGSSKFYRGKVIFAEIDSTYRHPFFRIEEVLSDLKPHEDGRPKSTKFISTYRTLEHIEISSIQHLYLATQEGHCIELQPGEYRNPHEEGFIRIYAEISPMRMLVLSDYDFDEFGRYVTDPENFKSAPKQFYTQVDLDIVEFLAEFEKNPFLQSPIESMHPSSLRDSFREIKQLPGKHTKGLCLDSSLDQVSYRLIRHGFMFAAGSESLFFAMPDLSEIEKNHYKFWRSM